MQSLDAGVIQTDEHDGQEHNAKQAAQKGLPDAFGGNKERPEEEGEQQEIEGCPT
jgi:hypothetical protein